MGCDLTAVAWEALPGYDYHSPSTVGIGCGITPMALREDARL